MGDEPKCEACNDTGYYGDNCAGIKGNTEYTHCECRTERTHVNDPRPKQ